MTIEERISNALLDLHSLLEEGVDLDDAVRRAAGPYNLKDDVLRIRAAPNGDLHTVALNLREKKVSREIEQQIHKVVRKFVRDGRPWFERGDQRATERNALVEELLGRKITSIEERYAEKADATESRLRFREIWFSIPSEQHAAD